MARVTVEDCVDKVESPYELVLVAKERTTQLNSGVEPTVSIDNDKNTEISLREIANENVKQIPWRSLLSIKDTLKLICSFLFSDKRSSEVVA